MKNSRNVLITGAGAVLPWKLPSTKEITELLCNDRVFVNDKGKTIGEYILKILKEKKNQYETRYFEPNFETILHFIEEMNEYRKTNSQMSYNFFRTNDFFELKECIEKELNSFENKNPNISSDKSLITSLGKRTCLLGERFYHELYLHFLHLIQVKFENKVKEIVNDDFKSFRILNNQFNNFLNSLKINNGIIRYYTLNYDDLPLLITKYPLFNGYDKHQINIKKIFNSDNLDCYYQLHGSFKLNFKGEVSDNYEESSHQNSFSNRTLIPSNYISGYNKLDRILGKPYFHFYNKLLDDCSKASQIIIIGYSFGDLHINAAINRAMLIGNPKLVLIDKCKTDNINDIREYVRRYYQIGPTSDYCLENLGQINNNSQITIETKNVKIYLNGIDNYLESY